MSTFRLAASLKYTFKRFCSCSWKNTLLLIDWFPFYSSSGFFYQQMRFMWSVTLTDPFNKLRMWHLVPQGKVTILLPLRENVTVRVSQLYEQRECRNPRFHFIDLNPVCCSCFVISFTPFSITRRHWVALFCVTFWVHLGQMSHALPEVFSSAKL